MLIEDTKSFHDSNGLTNDELQEQFVSDFNAEVIQIKENPRFVKIRFQSSKNP